MPSRTSNAQEGAASRKRRRTPQDDEEEDDEDIVRADEASSSLRHDSRKRARVSNVDSAKSRSGPAARESSNDSEGTDDVTESSDNEEDENNVDDTLPTATQYEQMRDAGFQHLRHEEEDDMRATQRIQTRSVVLGENRVADNGILESITCINFMCHTRLHCALGPLLNFIVGENGSGKSAILTAITLCLGGKASATNRGGSLKDFVKEGQNHAILTVTIKNQGIDAYKHDIYGDSIVVERHFSRTASSGYKVKSATGRVISNKKDDVAEIVEYYCLQVDNPLNILSQDNARQFLNASSASTKYKYFLEGVQLKALDRDYQLTKEMLDSVEQKVPEQEERANAAKRVFEVAEKRRKAMEDNGSLRRQRRTFTNQLVWAQVVDQERTLEQRERAVVRAEQSITEAEQMTSEKERMLEMATATDAEAKHTLERAEEMEQELQQPLIDAAKEFEAKRTELEGCRSDQRDVHTRAKTAQALVKELEAKIVEEQTRLQDANGDGHKRTQDRLAEAKRKEEEVREQLRAAEGMRTVLETKLSSAKSEVNDMEPMFERKRKDLNATQAKIESLKQKSGSPLDAYEHQLPSLLKLIANDPGFREKPIGPIGTYIKVVKPAWSSILEKTLGGNLSAFVVTSKSDQSRLLGLMRRLKIQRDNILIGNRYPLNTNGKEPDREFDTILRVLEFDDELVKNQLIINSSIEQIILIEDRRRAEEVMFNGPAPRNVVACLAQHDGRRGAGLRLTNKGGTNLATTTIQPDNQRPRMRSDVDSQLAVQGELLEQLRADLREKQQESDMLKEAVKSCASEIKTNETSTKRLQRKQREAQAAINQIEEELDKFDGADGRLQALEQELQLAQTADAQHGANWVQLGDKIKEITRASESLKETLRQKRLEMKDCESRRNKAAEKVGKCADLVQLANRDFSAAREEVDSCRADQRRAEAKRDEQKKNVEDFQQQAQGICPDRVYIPDGETTASVEAKIEAISKQLALRHSRQGMTDEEVNRLAAETKEKYDQSVEVVETTKKHLSIMKENLFKRLLKWRKFQRYISSNSRMAFQYLLSDRGYRGQLLLDHRRKRLEIRVEPDETNARASKRDTKTLSGGEKSFSSLCLLLAIWEAMGSPLRCLDEFDVFMDNVNRAVSTKLLIHAARRSVGRQFILITPNAVQAPNAQDKDVKMIRLTDPRQRTMADH